MSRSAMTSSSTSIASSSPKRTSYTSEDDPPDPFDTRIYNPPMPLPDDNAQESPTFWGFQDTRFQINPSGHVELTGTRYPLSGAELPCLLPWMEKALGLTLPLVPRKETREPVPPPSPILNRPFLTALEPLIPASHLSLCPQLRTRRSHGHSQSEIFSLNFSSGGSPRIPDAVITPTSTSQILSLVHLAVEHDVCLVPFGGGTNVSGALGLPPEETRMIVSLDLRRMTALRWVDPVNLLAEIEAGAKGWEIARGLEACGLTMGHEPDSFEFSTLGGWISTNASGMKRNRYGNIEELVLDVEMVTARGVLRREGEVGPRESTGCDPVRYVFGSEGNLGVITSAVVKVFPIPEVKVYGSVLFPDFETGLEFMYDLTRAGAQPASVRVVDNLQFQLSQVLKPATKGWFARIKSWLEKFYVLRVRGFDPENMAACTLVFEGSHEETRRQQSRVYALASNFGGLKAGAANGDRGYQMTFAIAYLRDFIMRHGIIAESFETSVSWSRAGELCRSVKERIKEEYVARGLPGHPFVTYRISQVYTTGVTVYFYFAAYLGDLDDPSGTYAKMEKIAREEILRQGGSLSHHHGIGKLRKEFLQQVRGETAMRWNRSIKAALDPTNVFGVGNGAIP